MIAQEQNTQPTETTQATATATATAVQPAQRERYTFKQTLLEMLHTYNLAILSLTAIIAASLISQIITVASASDSEKFISSLETAYLSSEYSDYTVYTTSTELLSAAQSEVEEALSYIPDSLKEDFTESKWRIAYVGDNTDTQQERLNAILNTSDTASVSRLHSFRGLTVPQSKLLVFNLEAQSDSESTRDILIDTTAHEFGHFLQSELMTSAENSEWEQVFRPLTNTEKWVSVSSSECFAEIFSDILTSNALTYPDNERDQYNFVQSIINKYITTS